MLEITADDIKGLDDLRLREVVARLCEAELRRYGYSPVAVTWGGDQNAGDGGSDVRVSLPPGSVISTAVPAASTVFQVKAENISPSSVSQEMRPKGALRPIIQELADEGGAYIIVSSKSTTSETALRKRVTAMRAAIGAASGSQLFLDFYDRQRIATWVRSHEGLIPWVRQLVGRPVQGWRPYGSWANGVEQTPAEYLADDKPRIRPPNRIADQEVSTLEGIRQIRDVLRQPRGASRLVGLSGVGKTRLLQALFDERIGERSLNRDLAFYTDMGESPDPPPTAIAESLVLNGTTAVLVIDNCPPDLHERLVKVCQQPSSKVSLITVEYDIQDDEAEGTQVFKLETLSVDLTERLVKERFANISWVDAKTAAEFSNGNPRIAFALAETVERGGSLAGLKNEELFRRLFDQRQGRNDGLYRAAQACSLLSSFEGENTTTGEGAELFRLAAVAGISVSELYRNVAELQRRHLVQRRGAWRAVLPHGIGNRCVSIRMRHQHKKFKEFFPEAAC